MTDHTPQTPLIDDLRRVTASELSLTARTGYVGLLLAAATMTVVVIGAPGHRARTTAAGVNRARRPGRDRPELGEFRGVGALEPANPVWPPSRGRRPHGSRVQRRVLRRCAGRGICDVEPERVRRRRHGRAHDRDSDRNVGSRQAPVSSSCRNGVTSSNGNSGGGTSEIRIECRAMQPSWRRCWH